MSSSRPSSACWRRPGRTRRPGIFAKFSERIALNDSGAVAFNAIRKGARAQGALFLIDDGKIRTLAALDDPDPGGGTFLHFGLWPSLGNQGSVAFFASVDGGPSPVCLFAVTGAGIQRAVNLGDPLPDGGTVRSFGLFPIGSISPTGAVTFATGPGGDLEGAEGIVRAQRDCATASDPSIVRDFSPTTTAPASGAGPDGPTKSGPTGTLHATRTPGGSAGAAWVGFGLS